MMNANLFSKCLPPRFWAALALLGVLAGCASAPDAGGSSTELRTASDDTPARKRARTRFELAASYYQNGQTNVALDEMKKAMNEDQTFAPTWNLGGLIYMKLGQAALAQSHFERAIALNPQDANAMHNLGWLQCTQGQYAAAEQLFQRALAAPMYSDRARTLMTQGICQSRGGDNAKAEATLLRSYELDAGNPVTGYNLAKLIYMRGDYGKAQFYIRRLNNSELANAESLWLGIQVEHRLNNPMAMDQLVLQLRKRFPESRQLQSYEKGAFDE